MALVSSFLLSPTWGIAADYVGQIDDSGFRMRVRHAYSNGLTRILYGRYREGAGRTRIEGEFRTLLWVVLVLRGVWLLLLMPVASYILEQARLGDGQGAARLAVMLSGPMLTLAFLIAIEAVGRYLGDRDEEKLRRHLNEVFADVSIG